MRRDLLICIALAIVTMAVFAQVRQFAFIDYDDPDYVTDNDHVRSGLSSENILWSFRESHAANWHPVTWMSHMLDCDLFGLKPGYHHLTNAFFHVLNSVLLFFLLKQMTGEVWRSAFVAGLFALHPLHVESVAWVSERKDVLSTFFLMLTIMTYVRHVNRPKSGWYWASLGLFGLGLLSKPMLVTLPCVLLLLDIWPLNRIRFWREPEKQRGKRRDKTDFGDWRSRIWPLIKEKIPFFALAIVSSAVTVWAQRRGGAISTIENVSLGYRLSNALVAYAGYIGKMLWPAKLAIPYPLTGSIAAWQVGGAFLFLVAVTALVIWRRRDRPYCLVGWLWYLGTLVPVIGLVQVGEQSMADRYTYVPMIGLFIFVAWGVADATAGWRNRTTFLGVAATVSIGACIACTSMQLRHWKNSITLFEHTIAVTAPNATAHYDLALAYAEQKRSDEAIHHYREAVRIRPTYYEAETNLGVTLAAQGKYDEAGAAYAGALRIKPDHARAHFNWGVALASQGKINDAMMHYSEAVRIEPDNVEARTNLGAALARIGRLDEAIAQYTEALRLRPGDAEAQNNLANALLRQGRMEEAIAHYSEAIRLRPNSGEFHFNLALTLTRQNKRDEAIQQLETALRLMPNFTQAQTLLNQLRTQNPDASQIK